MFETSRASIVDTSCRALHDRLVESLGDRIRKLRGSRTQSKLARELGTESLTVSRWELGRSEPSPENLAKLAGYFGVSEAFLRYGTVVTSEPVHDEALSEIDRALAPWRGQLSADLEAHIRRRHVEAKAFLGGGSMGRLVTFVEEEIAAWKRQHDGMPPKVKEAPATEVKVRDGAMKLERPARGPRRPEK